MKFRGVLLKTLDAQQDRDGNVIDPAGLAFDPEQVFVMSNGFNHDLPPAGWCKVHREDDGSLAVEGELSGFFPAPMQAAVNIYVTDFRREMTRNVVTHANLIAVGLTNRHSDLSQPWIEVEPA